VVSTAFLIEAENMITIIILSVLALTGLVIILGHLIRAHHWFRIRQK
jgi:hypothetical protein